MKQEDRDLLLKDLCSRLPYGVKVNYNGNVCTIQSISPDGDILLEGEGGIVFPDIVDSLFVNIEEVKPYLRPMSSMTEEQFKEMQEIIGNPNEACISVNTSGLELWLNSVDTDPTIWLDTIFEVQDWLNKNNFDFRGLIPKELAIDATNLNVY